MMPETINPRIPGILNFLSITDETRITVRITANTSTGSFTGS